MREDHPKFEALDAQIVAISAESTSAGERYLKKNPTPFPLIGDDDHQVFDTYDVISKMMSLGQRPALFVIDADGTVVYNQVGTQQFQIPPNEEILTILESLP